MFLFYINKYSLEVWVSTKKNQAKRPIGFIGICLLRHQREEPSPAALVDVSVAMTLVATQCCFMALWPCPQVSSSHQGGELESELTCWR